MPDFGAHSAECANADGGTCYCDCKGTLHGVTHAGGSLKRMEEVTITKLHGGGYKVADPKTGLPLGGGTASEKAKAARRSDVAVTTRGAMFRELSPAVRQHAAEVRARLPKTRDEWREPILGNPHEGSAAWRREQLDKTRADLADRERQYQERMAEWERDYRAQVEADPRYKGRAGQARKAEFFERLHEQFGGTSIEAMRETIARLEREIAEYANAPKQRMYPKSPDGRPVAPDEWNRHLDDVMSVGRETLAEARKAFAADPEWRRLRDDMDRWEAGEFAEATEAWRAADREAYNSQFLPKGVDFSTPESDARYQEHVRRKADAAAAESAAAARKKAAYDVLREKRAAFARREQQIVMEMLNSHRPFGGPGHTEPEFIGQRIKKGKNGAATKRDVLPARKDHAEVFRTAEQFYPADWLAASDARGKLRIGTAERAYYSDGERLLLSPKEGDRDYYTGGHGLGHKGAAIDVTVHEMGHRMEKTIPGLTQLEMALVLRRSTAPDGTLERQKHMYGYADKSEVSYHDTWANAYAGKTYQAWDGGDPGSAHWELFQVGMQDTFSRQTDFDKSDDLQAFVLGTLLTLG